MGRRRKQDRHLPERVYIRAGSYYFVNREGKWIPLGKTYRDAMTKHLELSDSNTICITIGDLLDRYLKEISPTKAESTYKTEVTQSKFLRAAFGKMRIEDLTPRAIYKYLDNRTAKVRANREFAMLSHMYKKAIRWGYVDSNPCVGIEKHPEKPRNRYIEDWEYRAFKDIAGPQIAAYCDLKLLTGLRQGDMLRLRRADLKDDGMHVFVSKTKQRIIVQWTDHLRAAISALEAAKSTDMAKNSMYLFCTRKGTPYTPDGFRSIWHRLMQKAVKSGAVSEKFTEHDLRGKTGSETDLEHAASLLAHLDNKTTQRHYRRKPSVVRPLK